MYVILLKKRNSNKKKNDSIQRTHHTVTFAIAESSLITLLTFAYVERNSLKLVYFLSQFLN